MPWQCRLVHKVGRKYEAAWFMKRDDNHYHSKHLTITEEQHGDFDTFNAMSPTVCDSCGQTFTDRVTFINSPTYNTEDGELHIGDMYFSELEYVAMPSPEYMRDWAGKRDPLFVVTPAGVWCIDQQSIVNGVWQGHGWAVTGEAPNVTASPSINFPGHYHGWLQNGILTDDCEGRVF